MNAKLQPVRGTHDILPEEFEKFHAVVSRARTFAKLYSFKEMMTPIFEATEVFSRSMGETSDVVSKEMFTFKTRGEDNVTLRPEFTAGIVRSFLSNGMQQYLPLKLFSTGPLFRYERPQKGRQRQFHQVNFEWLGDASPEADIELILLAGQFLYSLSGEWCTLHINTLGDSQSRERYKEALVAYLIPHTESLSEDSKRRLHQNPLRILDSKDERDKSILKQAPNIMDYLSEVAAQRFEIICKALKDREKDFRHEIHINPALVRGLDYYTDTVFEFISETGDLGSQNTILAGGRYDGLIEQMGGKPTPAIGFAAGVERLLLSLSAKEPQTYNDLKITVLPIEDIPHASVRAVSEYIRLKLWQLLNHSHTKRECSVETVWQGKLSKRLEKAVQRGATHLVMMGNEEEKQGSCIIKNVKTGIQETVPIIELMKRQNLIKIFNITELNGNEEKGFQAQ